MSKPPKFYTTERKGMTALWVDWGDGPHNLWDLPPDQVNDTILNAVQCAFERGMSCMKSRYDKIEKPFLGLTKPHYDKQGEYIGIWEHKDKE